MPWVIPTPEELAAMSWHAQQQARARVLSIRKQVERTRALTLLHPMEQARILLDAMPPDPDADVHWLALEEATR